MPSTTRAPPPLWLAEVIADFLASWRFNAILFTFFAALALAPGGRSMVRSERSCCA